MMDMLPLLKNSAMPAETLRRIYELGVCLRCCLRFTNISDFAIYAFAEQKIEQALLECIKNIHPVELKPHGGSGCTCCVGILRDAFYEKILRDVKQLSLKEDYDVKVFSLSIKLPGVVLLREYSLLHFLRANVENFPPTMSFDLKDVLKALLTPSISQMLSNAECASESEFTVLIEIKHEESAQEVRQIPAIKKQLEGPQKRGRGQAPPADGYGAISRALATLSSIPETITSPPSRLMTAPHALATFKRDSVFMQGRYLKYRRGLSQTPWIVDGQRLGESSVEECIGDLALPFFNGSGYKFHTAGREDVDVRMLGNGRPFILEILVSRNACNTLTADAKKAYRDQSEYEEIQKAVNDANRGTVEIVQVKSATKDDFAGLQAGADSKKKSYCCVVWSEGVLTPEVIARIEEIHNLTIQQQTPIRVLHRRTQMIRSKVIHSATCEVLNQHYMLLRLTTSAGTYVKEFVHGDRGRTNPNVASILVRREKICFRVSARCCCQSNRFMCRAAMLTLSNLMSKAS
ncbi:hypothetical protein PsorP6_014380 [Peronosclerospora sorghi]|uniref:Uncharacterized protein n=1 Tax=Peronosclerospora sorghi TaxID=230839 RepID=A0ACC0VHQ4_9STRA|nr:hypothetical protein PsorP6_014380 [Peronosclerospora sorghi]